MKEKELDKKEEQKMNGKFITNQNAFLSELINNILPHSEEMAFLVGYFYFSGYNEISKNISDKKMRILVGMDIDPSLQKGLYEIYNLTDKKTKDDNNRIREKVFENIVKMIESEDAFDNNDYKKSFLQYVKKIENGTLELRKTLEPNHAKLYIFKKEKEHSEGGSYPGIVITGSSNLSVSGMKDRMELNVILRDKSDFEEAEMIFNDLWKKSVPIANKDNFTEFFKKVVEKTWMHSLPAPILMYLRVLEEYFMIEKPSDIKYPSAITEGHYLDFEYQKDAVNKAISVIQKHNGVIIADVVGLGKSIIALTVARYFNIPTIVISPPHLSDQWRNYRREFGLNAEIYTSGKIETAYEDYKTKSKEMMIIIDECHKYRNEFTDTYGSLHKLCAGNKVMILTATPFNNEPQDIFSMISLFQIPAKSTLQTTESLAITFKRLIKEYRDIKNKKKKKEDEKILQMEIKKLGDEIRDLVNPFVIRRTRLDLEAIERYRRDLERQNISFSKINPPKLMTYNLGELTSIYEWTLDQICPENIKPEDYKSKKKGLIGARYQPTEYLKDYDKYKKQVEEEFGNFELFAQGQRNIADFMRRMLVMRFESSINAFRESLNNMIDSYNEMIQWIEVFGLVPIYKRGEIQEVDDLEDDIEEFVQMNSQANLFGENIGTMEELRKKAKEDIVSKLKEKGIWFIDIKEIKVEFKDEIERDIKLLEKVKEKWFGGKNYEDVKLIEVKKHLTQLLKENDKRKIIIFSQFKDTVDYLYESLKKDFKAINYSSEHAKGQRLRDIISNFDAGLPHSEQKNDYDILIATDAISEGYNLHRAGIIVNYDIPYNPTRVIQRVGRINRINKKVFDELFIYNCFPTYIGEQETNTKAISTLKIAMIHALLGGDTKILTSDEELESFFSKEYQNANGENEEKSWDTEYLEVLDKYRFEKTSIYEASKKVPLRSRIRRKMKNDDKGILTFIKKGTNYLFTFIDNENRVSVIEPQKGLKLFEANDSEEPFEVSDGFEDMYKQMKRVINEYKKYPTLERNEQGAIENINILKGKLKDEADYFDLLLKIIKELNALPDVYVKFVKDLDLKKHPNELIIELKKMLPISYLKQFERRADKIDEEKETVILSEEF